MGVLVNEVECVIKNRALFRQGKPIHLKPTFKFVQYGRLCGNGSVAW